MMNQLTTSSVYLQFGGISVNVINQSSGIFVGQNYQYAWSSHYKALNGFGIASGMYNHALITGVYILDNDYIDSPILDNDVVTGNAVSY